MKLRDIYASTKPAFSFEFFPPKSEKGEASLMRAVERLKALGASFFSMTYGAGGSTREKTIDLGDRIRRSSGVETVCHVTCVGQSKAEVLGVIAEIRERGMENVMALRGDPPSGESEWKPHPGGFRYAHELVREIHEVGDFSVAVAGFPETHPEAVSPEADLRFLKEKVEAGADAIVTQLFFDNEDFYRFDRDVRALDVKATIVPGIMPILSVSQIQRITTLSHARIPPDLAGRLKMVEHDDQAARRLGIEFAAEQIRGLLEYGVAGIHLYCLNRAAPAEAIFGRLGLA